jgi:DNA repair protein RadD
MGDFRKDDIEKLTSDQDKMRRQVQDALSRLDGRKKICWACSSIAHSEALKEELIRCGENAVALHSGQSKEDQSNAKASFESGPMRHLTFVSIVSEGYDYPPIDAMILMRPTRSPVLYVQTIGRALRPSEGKIDAMILDYGKVIESCGPLDNPIIRSKSTPKAMLKKAQMKFCPECLEYTSPRASECHVCGHSFVTEIKKSFTEKLEMQSYDGPLFSNTPKEEKIRMVCFSRHKSKNGNDCLKISYRPFGIFDESINEFFVVNNDYGFGKLMDRVKCFGISHFSDDIFGRHFSFEGEKTLSIKHRADGNYRKIVSLDFSKASA